MLLVIEGNIASGKTTLIKQIQDYCCRNLIFCNVIFEPHNVWNNYIYPDGNNALLEYYSNIKKNASEFQLLTLIARISLLNNFVINGRLNVVERSIDSCVGVFGEMLVKDGYMTREQLFIHSQFAKDFYHVDEDAFNIYLECDEVECFARCRNRNEESNPGLEYLGRLECCYKENFQFCNSKDLLECIKKKCNKYHLITKFDSLENVLNKI